MKSFYTIFLIGFFLITSCEQKEEINGDYLLQKTTPSSTGIYFKNNVKDTPDQNIINYIYYYNGAGVAVGDINNDSLPDLYFVSNKEKNKLYLNKGDFKFEDISKTSFTGGNSDWSTGATMVDINDDGFLDIYVCAVSQLLGFEGRNELFINNGDGTFTEKAKEYGLDFQGYSTQAYFFDYDKDNDLDVYIVNHATHTVTSHGKANLRNKRKPLVGDVLMRNDNGKFTDVSKEANIYGGINGYGLSASIADFNNDGWEDIYVANDFHEDDYYYINNQDGSFREELGKHFSTISRFSMGSDAADINGDGFQDIMTLDMLPFNERVIKESEGDDAMYNMQERLRKLGYKDQYSRNMLQISKDGDYFYETAFLNGVAATDWSWAPLFADFNNDSHQDLFISNGINKRPNDLDFKKYVSSTFKQKNQKESLEWLYKSLGEMPSGKVPNMIYEGNSKKFKNRNGKWIDENPTLSNGAIYADLDLDGDLDIIVNNFNDYAGLYKNQTDTLNNYLSVKAKYQKGNSNGIGTKAILYSNGKSQLKQVFHSRGFLSSTNAKLHFGLGQNETIDSLLIIWPNNSFQKIVNPGINQTLVVNYKENGNSFVYKKNKNKVFSTSKAIAFKHQEDSYYDSYYEKTIPYQVSKLGPAVAIGDVDGNGYDDVFLGNGSETEAKLFLNNGYSFTVSNQSSFKEDAFFEDNDAAFFDADGDGDLDLYVSSGINAQRNGNYEIDRLYINERGQFKKSKNKTLINPLNTSTIKPYDYDGDGDTDLFVGNLSNPNDFGQQVNSAILENDGKGNFKANFNFQLKSKVTSAAWKDINNDGQKDLLIATEWDAPKIFLNNNGTLSALEIPESLNGLWQSITSYDIDNDGDNDILLGNWGMNTKLNPSAENPLVLYYGDFDVNNKKEAILSYTIDGKQYPVNSKDELASQMNIINKRFVEHKNFAEKTMEEVLSDSDSLNATKFTVQTLASGYLENTNGQFLTFKKFPQELQLGPIRNFEPIEIGNKKGLLISGNSLSVNTYHGGYTSMKGIFLKSINDYQFASDLGIHPFNKQISATKVVKMKNQKLLLVSQNNDSLKVYSFKN